MPEKFNDYLSRFKRRIKSLFAETSNGNPAEQKKGVSPRIMDQIADLSPSAVSIPETFGGRGSLPSEILSLLEATAYESLPLALVLGINGALFLEPLAKYGDDKLKSDILRRFVDTPFLGGLMITEPGYGTDALAMKTSWHRSGAAYAIQGTKHWAGLSGSADFWLMTAREQGAGSHLKRDIDFFICDSSDPMQIVRPIEAFSSLGLHMIPYALNHVDVEVPSHHRLIPHRSGIRLMQDLLHRSRMRFPGTATGFIQRMMDEAVSHTDERVVGGRILSSYDQVQKRLADLQADHTIASAFSRHSATISSIENDLSDKSMEANIQKTVMSDMMHNAAQSLLQLVGAKGYKTDHIAGRSVVDSRPFQIFEGSNDVIYQQVADGLLKHMHLKQDFNFASALRSHPLTMKIADRFKRMTNFIINPIMPQRKKVDLGRVFSRITSLEWAQDLGNGGYNADLVNNAVNVMTERIQALMGSFQGLSSATFVPVESGAPSSWRQTL